jgi:hypothetical protein
MRRIQDVHRDLLGLIEIRDAAGARRMMDDHVKMIRARRVSEHGKASQPLGSAKAGGQGESRSRSRQRLDSRLRGNDRGLRVVSDDDSESGADCC